MAACRNLQHIFDTPLPENQTLLGSLQSSWSQNIKTVEQTEHISFSELFGELCFKENFVSSSSFPLPSVDSRQISTNENQKENKHPSKELSFSAPLGTIHSSCNKSGFSPMKLENLQLCTEGLGFESLDDIEDLQSEMVSENRHIKGEKTESTFVEHLASGTSSCKFRRSKMSRRTLPPPISFIGKSGKLGVCFKSYRQDGRFVLKEVRIPTQEFLQAHREHGRLKLQIIQPNDNSEEEDEGVEDSENDDEEENDVCDIWDNDEASDVPKEEPQIVKTPSVIV